MGWTDRRNRWLGDQDQVSQREIEGAISPCLLSNRSLSTFINIRDARTGLTETSPRDLGSVCKVGTQDPENLDEELKPLVTARSQKLTRGHKDPTGAEAVHRAPM